MKKTFLIFAFLSLMFLSPRSVFAHAVVKPSVVPAASYQNFTLAVSNEKNNPTVQVRIVLPDNISSVTPNVKTGWKISSKRDGTNPDSKVTEITWANGVIPEGQRDEFVFSAKVPSTASTLVWKVYQTYQDGTVVSWDQDSSSEGEGSAKGPASHTQVIVDLGTPKPTPIAGVGEANKNPTTLSIIALALSAFTLVKVFSSKKGN